MAFSSFPLTREKKRRTSFGVLDMGRLEVVFLVKETGAKVTKVFDSPYHCRLFVNKLKHSKKLCLIAYPILD